MPTTIDLNNFNVTLGVLSTLSVLVIGAIGVSKKYLQEQIRMLREDAALSKANYEALKQELHDFKHDHAQLKEDHESLKERYILVLEENKSRLGDFLSDMRAMLKDALLVSGRRNADHLPEIPK